MTDGETVGRALSDLRRRKVVQWGLGYAAVAWTLLQVIEYLAETYDWPPAIRQLAVPALALGVLFVLMLAWYHGDKGAQKVSRPELALLTVLLLLAGGAMWAFVARLDDSAWLPASVGGPMKHAVPTDAPSVAVLPFVNMSADPEQEYFADGLSEEILNSLARIPGLFVPARTSSFQFKGQAGDVAKFAAMLGVAHVLEGSVRKAGGRVRITAQLINAADGYHVWSQTYDRELQDIFAIQTEISNAIAEALKVKLTAQQKLAATTTAPTANLEAYEAYLLGRFELNKRRLGSMQKAIEYFEQALRLDPQFAAAKADMAIALIFQAQYRDDFYDATKRQEAFARARILADEALAAAPHQPEALTAVGFVTWQEGNWPVVDTAKYEQALDYLNRSLALRPSNGEALMWRKRVLGRLERHSEAVAASYEMVKLDPLSWLALNEHVNVLMNLGRRDEAQAAVERLRSLNETQSQRMLAQLAFYDGDRVGYVREVLRWADLRAAHSTDTPGDWQKRIFGALSVDFAALGLEEELRRNLPALDVYQLLGDCKGLLPLARKEYQESNEPRAGIQLAGALYGCGEYGEAATVLAPLLQRDVSAYASAEYAADLLIMAADLSRRSGSPLEARTYRDRAYDYLARRRDAGFASRNEVAAVWGFLHAYDGNDVEAARHLILAVQTGLAPYVWMHYWPRIALLAPVLARQDVQAALNAQKALLERQRPEVLRMLCGPNPVSKHYKPAPETCARAR